MAAGDATRDYPRVETHTAGIDTPPRGTGPDGFGARGDFDPPVNFEVAAI